MALLNKSRTLSHILVVIFVTLEFPKIVLDRQLFAYTIE